MPAPALASEVAPGLDSAIEAEVSAPVQTLLVTTRKIQAIEETLQQLLATVLKVAPADVSKSASFMNLGIDSMDALDLVQKLEAVGFRGLPATLFFEYQTIADLAHHLSQQPTQPEPQTPAAASPTHTDTLSAATYPLTPIQRAFAISHILYPARPAVAFLRQTVQGVLQLDRLQQAVNQIAARHPLLRTRFTLSHATADTLTPIICPPDDPTITPLIETITEQTGVDGLATLEARLINRPFDLATGSPWRIMAVADQQQPARWHLLLALHHIVGDAWSLSLVAHELWALYTALTQGRTLDLPTPPSPWQASPLPPEPEAAALAWWRQQVAHDAPALPLRLPFDHDPAWLTPDEWDTTQYTAHATPLTPVQSAALTQLAADHQLSLFHLVLALYLRALQQWSAATELVINVADAQRPPHLPGIMDMVGSFADTLPLWLTIDPAEPVLGLAERVRQQWLLRQPHKRVSSVDLARLLAEVAPPTHATQPRQLSPLGFSFARFDANPPADCPVNIVEIFGRTATPTMRLSLVGWEFAGALHFSWNYVTPLFQPATIETLAAHFSHEIAHLLGANRSQDVGLSLGKRKTDVLTTDHQAGEFVPVHALVQAQAQRTPHAIAVWANGAALTYAELDDRSSQVAAALGDLNEKCAPVGLLAQPSTAAVELLLGIAKAGAAWVPLDPAHPPLRHADQLGQAGVQILVFPADLAAAAAAIQVEMAGAIQLYSLDDLLKRREDFRLSHLPKTKVLTTDQIAYIIFTSGSTGRPKGVPITHGALANYIGWAVDTFGYSPADRVMQATSLCFDASIRQLLAPLVTGGTVVPVASRLLADPQALLHFIQENQITIWSSVPALWGRLLSALESNLATGKGTPALSNLRWIQVGGEALPAQLVRRWFDLVGDRQQIANLYGPTETTINATCYIVPGRPAEAETQIPIGYPVRGAQLLVCDEAGQPCPAGAIGELWIGGVGLSPGYLGDAQRTQERFVTVQAGLRFYSSGDRVQQGADGALRFLGRLDEQVKVRGYRIELGEIEAMLSQHPAIRLAAVIARQAGGDERLLIAYLECADAPPTEESIRQWLQQRLPDYMAPHQFYVVERLPQMPNGKIDRQSLIRNATIARALPRADKRTAPQTATEQKLAALWATVLHRSTEQAPIAREDDFFALGGDSLQAIRLFVELGKTGAAVPRATYLYRYRTLAALAQALDEYQPSSDAAATIPMGTGAATEEQFGVSLAQAGFLLARALHNNEATSWCARFWLTGPLQIAHFQEAVQMLVERHAMLRAVFPPSEGRPTRAPQQRIIQPAHPLPVHFVDWQALNAAEQQSAIAARWEAVHSRQFDPAQWPLIEMHLCRLTPTDHLWFVATDHLIGDGLSGWLLGQELLQLYDALVQGQAPTLPPLRSTFRDYVTVQQRHEQQPDPAAEAHWRQVFATPYQPPKRRAAERANAGGWVHQSVDLTIADVEQMERYAADLGVTPYELLLTLFFRQLQRLTHQADLVVGSAIAGRDEPLPDIMRIFGAFATALPLRVHLVEEGWAAQVQGVAQAFQSARAHTLSPRRIAQLMHPQTPLTAALGAQFLFSYMDFTALGPLHSDTLQMRWEASQTELQPPTLAADLVLTGRKVAGQLRLLFTAPAAAMTAAQMATSVDTFAQELVGYSQQQGVTSRKDFSLSPTQRKTKVFPTTASPLQFTDQPLESNQVSAHARPGVDAALLGYLPPFTQIQRLLGAQGIHLEANDLRQLLFPEQQPRWLEQLVTPLGQSGLIAIPRFADELATLHPDQLAAEIKQAMRYAATLGARCVSLAGMLPAHTRYGYRLLAEGQNANQPALTTGHSTTVVAVVKTIQAVLAATGQALSTVALGCLGVGSIGSAALQLLLNMVGHPATITLCDVAGSADRLAALAATLSREFDYQGNVRIIEGSDQLPRELYQLDLLVGATSRPNVLEVDRLAPGMIVVDDSFPPCFVVDQAIERMRTAQDVLLVGGGLLQCGAVARTIHLPVAHPALRNVIAGQLHAAAIASCQLEALLWAARPGLPLTHGIATLPQAVPYWAAAEAMGITAAPLHLRDFSIADPLLQQIKARIAQRRQAPVQ